MIGVVAGVAIYYLVEVPVLKWRNSLKTKKPVSQVERVGLDTGL